MVNYDFNNKLEETEFERFARDIIQIREKITLESFTVGPDGGIDFRKEDNDNSIIVQVKNIKKLSNLLYTLKEIEINKIRRLKPKRYILVTSYPLTPGNKDQIKEILKETNITTDDIIGADDLNNYLGQEEYKNIEINYPNLWFNSGNVFFKRLDNIVHHEIFEESRYEYTQINELIPYYVPLQESPKLIKNLLNERFLLITGGPGMGKTSLARFIASYFIQKKDYEFIFVKRVNEANKVYKDNEKQIFLFDDFWGSSFKDDIYGYEEESKLGAFIKKINHTNNKILILTSRDYVLEQGLINHGKLKDIFDKNKHTINMKSFSFELRKNILIKLLDKSTLPAEYLKAVLYNIQYIIKEEHFNPRILNDFINNNSLEFKNEHEFIQELYKAIIEPFDFYQKVYNCLSINSKLALYLIRTTGNISYDNFSKLYKNAIDYAINNTNLQLQLFSASSVIKQLDKSFIDVIDINGEKLIKFQNNSIPDFLIKYDEENLAPYEKTIINSLTFFDQIKVIILKNNLRFRNFLNLNKINYETCIDILIERFYDLKIINEKDYHNGEYIYINELDDNRQLPFKLLMLLDLPDFSQNTKIKNLVITEFNKLCERLKRKNRQNFTDDDLGIFIEIVKKIKKYTKLNSLEMISLYFNNCLSFNEFNNISDFNSFYPKRFKEFIYSPRNSYKLLEGYKNNIIKAYRDKDFKTLLEYSKILDGYCYFRFPDNWLEIIQKYFDAIPLEVIEEDNKKYEYKPKNNNNQEDKFEIIRKAERDLKINDEYYLDDSDIYYYVKNNIADNKIEKECINYINNNDDFSITNYKLLNYIISFFKEKRRKPKCITELIEWIITNIINSTNINKDFFFKYAPLLAFALKNDSECFILDNIKSISKSILNSDDFLKILNSNLFIYNGKWYRFISYSIYKYLYVLYIKNNDYSLYDEYHYTANNDGIYEINYRIPIEIDSNNYAKYMHSLLSKFFKGITGNEAKYDIVKFFITFFDIELGFKKLKNNDGCSYTNSNPEILDLIDNITKSDIIYDCFPDGLFKMPGMKKYIRYNYFPKRKIGITKDYIFNAKIHFENDRYYYDKLEKYGIVDKIYNYYLEMKRLYEFTEDNYCKSIEDYRKIAKGKKIRTNTK